MSVLRALIKLEFHGTTSTLIPFFNLHEICKLNANNKRLGFQQEEFPKGLNCGCNAPEGGNYSVKSSHNKHLQI